MTAAAKQTLRKQLRLTLLNISDADRKQQTKIITEKFLRLPEYINCKRLAIYLSTANEVGTADIISDALASGRACFVPRYTRTHMCMLRVASVADIASLPLTPWKIPQPRATDGREDAMKSGGLDLIVMPGLGFTVQGVRLGQGKGYYDSFLLACQKSQSTKPKTVALGFGEQRCEQIPLTPRDVTLGRVLFGDDE